MSILVSGDTNIGMKRKSNQDSILLAPKYKFFMVADGMGGHKSGEVASKIAIDSVQKYYYSSKTNPKEAIKEALSYAHKEIKKVSLHNANHSKMGTTCTAVTVIDRSIYIGHAGDSRAYLVSNNTIKQLTKDHTYVEHLYNKVLITEQEKLRHPDRNIVTMVLGTQSEFIPEVYSYENVFGSKEILMLCSDGLYEYIQDNEIMNILTQNEASYAAEILVETAKKRGGHDNISVVIVRNKKKNEIVKTQITKQIN